MSRPIPRPVPRSLQDLPPRWAHFCLGVERFLLQDLGVNPDGGRLVVALSGGVDSTALLLTLLYLSPRLDCTLLPVHLDHAIRADSHEDAQATARLCGSLGLECIVERRDVPALARERNIGLEEAGRLARLELLAQVRGDNEEPAASGDESEDYAWAATGHQLDDLAEDQLMRQLRGVGWPALGGMRAVVPEERLLRPLLLTPKALLREFLRDLGLAWREDPSNQDTAFLRNRVRHEILPLLLRENPAYLDSAAALWRQARLDESYWEGETARVLAAARTTPEGGLLLSGALLENCAKALRLRVCKACLESLGPGQPLAESLFRLERAWQEKRLGATLQFPGGKEVKVTPAGLLFRNAGA